MKRYATIENSYNFWGYFWNAFAMIFFASIAVLYLRPDLGGFAAFIIFTLLILGMFLGRYIWVHLQLHRRGVTITEMAAKHKWVFAETCGEFVKGIDFSELSLNKLSEKHDLKYKNCIVADDWAYCDYSYGIYRHSKYGDYKAGETHYAVIAAKLPRSLPNVLFDSVKSRKRQFRMKFASTQLHKLEGDFDKYFATYFPEEYTIDSLSFITPDVMWALRSAADYDIEIIDDQLFIFGTMTNPEKQIPEMVQHLTKIKKELLDNILTYRDERLPYGDGRKRVAIQGQVLRASKWPLVWTILSFVLIAAYWAFVTWMKTRE